MKEKTLLRDFFQYVTFNICGMLGLSCYILADTFFISKGLGASGLTALNLAIPIYSFVHGSGLMLGMGGATRYSIYKSQKNIKRQTRLFQTPSTCCLQGLLFSCWPVFSSLETWRFS